MDYRIFKKNRSFFVKIEEAESMKKSITAGVPQGSPLSPMLFSLLINEIGKVLDKFKINYALYADDLTIWKIHSRKDVIQKALQQASTAINKFFLKIGLNINEKKCLYSTFSNKRSALNFEILINNTPIQYTPNPCVLGVILDKKLNFREHFDDIIKKLSSKINLLKILSYKSSGVNINSLLTIYKSLILSKIQYGMIPFLISCNKTKSNLQTIQNKCLKIILNVPRNTNTELLHSSLKIDKLERRLKALTTNYLNKAFTSNNSIKSLIKRYQPADNQPNSDSRNKKSILNIININ